MKKLIGSLILAASLATLASGCVVRGRARATFIAPRPVAVVTISQPAPPPPRVVTWNARPGFIYIEGRWNWNGNQYIWMDGHYERERANYIYRPGRWDNQGGRHVWVEGGWNANASGGVTVGPGNNRPQPQPINNGPTVRDHRNNPPPPPPQGGPTVRDHRR